MHTFDTTENSLYARYLIKSINANEIIANKWAYNSKLLIIPGGRDLAYAEKLNGAGNQNIKNYVKNGGSYLGICAGAYYASSYIEFDKGRELEVVGKREMKLFSGKSIGPILGRYSYTSNSGARATKQKLNEIGNGYFYYNGGGYFADCEKYSDVKILGYYENDLPSIIEIPFYLGRVILSGVHFEYNPELFDLSDGYLQAIYPKLRKCEAIRKVLVRKIFSALGC